MALIAGSFAIWYYGAHDLTLSHYDAKAHLVVARRIIDSLTPGWRQIGAVWLPLPHVLNALPVQVDAWYRTGASGVAISLFSFAAAASALAWLVARLSGSTAAAMATLAAFVWQPDLLYLQATPMTEPLLLGLTLCGVALLYRWTSTGGTAAGWPAGVVLALACLTRYEAWPITVAALGVAALVLLRHGAEGDRPPSPRLRRAGQDRPYAHSTNTGARGIGGVLVAVARVAVWPLLALLLFLVLSKATVGEWLVTGGFYEANNPAHRQPLEALVQVGWGLGRVGGWPLAWTAAAGAVLVLVAGVVRRDRQAWWFILALAACAALPYYAFVSGHPFRIRYMIPLIAASAGCVGLLIGLLPRSLRVLASVVVIAVVAVERRPFGLTSPMVMEAQWDRANQRERRTVTACLLERWRGEPILVSMGSLAHYMQEMSHDGFVLRHFVHEGIGDLWYETLDSPRRHVGFVLVEERAEGGDLLFQRAQRDPSLLDGFTRVCEGGGVALYARER